MSEDVIGLFNIFLHLTLGNVRVVEVYSVKGDGLLWQRGQRPARQASGYLAEEDGADIHDRQQTLHFAATRIAVVDWIALAIKIFVEGERVRLVALVGISGQEASLLRVVRSLAEINETKVGIEVFSAVKMRGLRC